MLNSSTLKHVLLSSSLSRYTYFIFQALILLSRIGTILVLLTWCVSFPTGVLHFLSQLWQQSSMIDEFGPWYQVILAYSLFYLSPLIKS